MTETDTRKIQQTQHNGLANSLPHYHQENFQMEPEFNPQERGLTETGICRETPGTHWFLGETLPQELEAEQNN